MILFLGPCFHKSGQVGGVVVLFELLKKELVDLKVEHKVIDTNKGNYKSKFVALFLIYFKTIVNFSRADQVSIHGTYKDFLFLAPLVVFLGFIFNKKVSLRKFAGNFIDVFKGASFIERKIISWTLRHSYCNFFETKYLVSFFKNFNKNTYWMPNSRNTADFSRAVERPFSKKFVFLGQISNEKGIQEILGAKELIDNTFQIDLYGNLLDNSLGIRLENSTVNYKGVIKSDQVANTLKMYDCLLLPSYREGYPGVIVEAFSVGIPVIATNLEGIKEIVQDQVNGILINPNSSKELAFAMTQINKKNYKSFSSEAKMAFNQFDNRLVTKKFLERLNAI